MIRLINSSQALQFKTGTAVTANQLPIVVSYSDKTSSQYNGAPQATLSTGTTLVTICNAPVSLIGDTNTPIRDIDTITVINLDTTPKLIFIYFFDGSILYTIRKQTLAVGDQLEYTHADGWKTVDSAGNIKTNVGTGSPATVENSDTTYMDTVASGGTLVLPDTNVDIYVNTALNQSLTVVTLGNDVVNISI